MIGQRRQEFLDQAVDMGYLELKKELPELTPASMRQPLPGKKVLDMKAVEVEELNPRSMRQKK